jgi:hypothetical protein
LQSPKQILLLEQVFHLTINTVRMQSWSMWYKASSGRGAYLIDRARLYFLAFMEGDSSSSATI